MEWSPIIISLKTAVISIGIVYLLGIVVADRVMAIKSAKLQMLIDVILTLGLVLPPTVIGFMLLSIFGSRGVVGIWLLEWFAIKIVFSWQATVIAAIVISFPLMYRSARGAFEQLDANILDAGRTLGMSEWDIFWKVKIPNAMPSLLAGGVLSFARGLGEYGATSMLAGNILNKTRTLPLAVASEVAAGNQDKASLYVIILVSISVVLLMALQCLGGLYYKKGVGK